MNFLEALFTGNSPLAKLVGIGLQTYAGEVQESDGQKRYVAPYSVQAQCLLSRYKGLALSEDGGSLSSSIC
jgi:hypothetical protein